MAYSVKTIKGRKYLYHQRSYRIGKKVKTKSTYIGPVAGALTIGIRIAVDAKARDLVTKSNKSLLEKAPTVKSEPIIPVGLGFRSDWNAEKQFQHESGTSAPFASSSEQPSHSADSSEGET